MARERTNHKVIGLSVKVETDAMIERIAVSTGKTRSAVVDDAVERHYRVIMVKDESKEERI